MENERGIGEDSEGCGIKIIRVKGPMKATSLQIGWPMSQQKFETNISILYNMKCAQVIS
jgi:hypothetical protein